MLFKIRVVLILFSMLTLTSCFSNKLAVIKKGEKYGCINKKGILKIDTVWDYILLDKRGKPNLVELDGLYGYIDRKGNILVKPQFDDADLFSEGLALAANSQEKYGFINKKGDIIIDFRFDENAWGEFSNGYADVVINDKTTLDRLNKEVIFYFLGSLKRVSFTENKKARHSVSSFGCEAYGTELEPIS